MKPQGHRLSVIIIICLFSLLLAGGIGVYGSGHLSRLGSLPQWQGANPQSRQSAAAGVDSTKRAQIIAAYGKLPLRFEANQGQTATPVKFISRNGGQTLFLTADEAVLELRHVDSGIRHGKREPLQKAQAAIARMKLVGANASAQVVPLDELSGNQTTFSATTHGVGRRTSPATRESSMTTSTLALTSSGMAIIGN